MTQLTHGSLFAGIGGFDLGFERAGIKTVWQVEIDPFCRKVLEKHWPGVPRFNDIRNFDGGMLGLECDIITGGFPCQPFSNAGRRKGKDDNRYLWPEMLRVISSVRPSFVVAENVGGLLSMQGGRVIGEILASLEAEGYTVLPPLVLPACAFGAGHRRDRVWIIAHSQRERESQPQRSESDIGRRPLDSRKEIDADAEHNGPHSQKADAAEQGRNESQDGVLIGDVRNFPSERFPDWSGGEMGQPESLTEFERSGGREIERDFRGMAHGVSNRVDRLKSLGNSIVPQIAEWIGRRIVACHERTGS